MVPAAENPATATAILAPRAGWMLTGCYQPQPQPELVSERAKSPACGLAPARLPRSRPGEGAASHQSATGPPALHVHPLVSPRSASVLDVKTLAEVLFERVCREHGITAKLTKPYSPTTTTRWNGGTRRPSRWWRSPEPGTRAGRVQCGVRRATAGAGCGWSRTCGGRMRLEAGGIDSQWLASAKGNMVVPTAV